MRFARNQNVILWMLGVRRLTCVRMIALTIFLVAPSSLEAAPVTFRFEAEITSISPSPDATFDLPFNVAIGDTLSGLLQFEPFDFGQNGEASSLRVNLGAEVFSAEGAIPFGVLDNFTVAHGPLPGVPYDSIGVGCPNPGACAAVLLSSSNSIELASLYIGLSSSVAPPEIGGDVISPGEWLGDVNVWNRLLSRQLFMDFSSNSDPGSIRLDAVFGPLVAIPEPSSLLLILIGILGTIQQFSRSK